MAKSRTSFKPGQSGNPNGRPQKGTTLTDILLEKLPKEEFVEKEIKLALKGDPAARKQIWDRIDGKTRIMDPVENKDIEVTVRMIPPDQLPKPKPREIETEVVKDKPKPEV